MADEIIPTGGKKRFQPHCDQMKIWQWLPLHQVCNVANVLQIYKKIQRKYTTRLVLLKAYLRKFEPIPYSSQWKRIFIGESFFLKFEHISHPKKNPRRFLSGCKLSTNPLFHQTFNFNWVENLFVMQMVA
jgi:hypothetical protein